MAKCQCEGFEDCWDQSREMHFTRTIHEEDCPESYENRMSAKADHDRDVESDERAMRESEPEQWDDLD
jgi:hypothetical protein